MIPIGERRQQKHEVRRRDMPNEGQADEGKADEGKSGKSGSGSGVYVPLSMCNGITRKNSRFKFERI
jgi:hypothetical protein